MVTATILEELERTLVEHFALFDPAAIRRRVAQVAAALSHHTHHEGDITAAAVASVNRKDRHVAATALVAKRTRRPATRSELIDQLAGSFPGFAAELRLRAD